jgi:hypothetical protein
MNMQTGKMRSHRFNFGPHKGKLYLEIFKLDKDYIKFCLQHNLIKL